MKKKYLKIKIEIISDLDNVILSSPGIAVQSEEDLKDTTVDDIFSGWWL